MIIPASGETALDIASAACVNVDGVALGGDINIIRCQQNGVFWAYYLRHKKHDIARLAQGISVIHLYAAQLRLLKIRIPYEKEQQKIAAFLSSVDTKIEQLSRKKALWERYKQGMMQKLFSQEIRFKDEQGQDYPEWKEERLSDVLSYVQPTDYLVKESDYDDAYKTPVLTAGKTFLLGYTDEKSGIFVDPLPVIIFDDFTTAFQYVDFPFKAKSSAMKILVPKDEGVNVKYVYEAMKGVRFPLGEHKRYWISEYQREKIPYPCKQEQWTIARFLSAIDQKTELVAEQLKQVQIFKKGLLQQMFV